MIYVFGDGLKGIPSPLTLGPLTHSRSSRWGMVPGGRAGAVRRAWRKRLIITQMQSFHLSGTLTATSTPDGLGNRTWPVIPKALQDSAEI